MVFENKKIIFFKLKKIGVWGTVRGPNLHGRQTGADPARPLRHVRASHMSHKAAGTGLASARARSRMDTQPHARVCSHAPNSNVHTSFYPAHPYAIWKDSLALPAYPRTPYLISDATQRC